MSYIIKTTSPFVSIKLTEIGRQQLAMGQLTFASWAIGDSELNYNREAILDANPNDPILSATSKILRPVDQQPDFQSYITINGSTNPFNTISAANINVVQATVNNQAEQRGFFSGSYTGTNFNYTTLTSTTYSDYNQLISNTNFTGGTILLGFTSTSNFSVGDKMLVKLTNDVVTGFTANTNTVAIPNLWFKIQAITSNGVTVDRNLPNNSQYTGNSQVIIYRGGEVYNTIATGNTTAYWDSGTLSFDSASNITCLDVPVWDMNNVWCEDLAGMTGLTTSAIYQDYTKFGSYRYLGTKNPYLQYFCLTTATTLSFNCNGPGFSFPDEVSKSISILHYTNNTISNLYGEFLYVDTTNNKTVVVTMPDLMYHNIGFPSGSGKTMGMSFVASGATQIVGNGNIEYVDLIEDPSIVTGTPKVVGAVYPQLKIVVIFEDEIVAAISYKSNRNWTLPPLAAVLAAPSGGTSTGILAADSTMYLTYSLENHTTTGLTTSLPCQDYVMITNNTSAAKDVSFRIGATGLLPYMRKVEKAGYDGIGFSAYNFKIVYQIVQNPNARPDPNAWLTYDYTSTGITTTVGATIDPVLLENQNNPAFVLTSIINSAATQFDITQSLSMTTNASPNGLQFGEERFFYGNLQSYIGATIYKTIFDIRINASQFNTTTNPTRSTDPSTNPPNIKVSEVGIYDANNNLVIVGKLSTPVPLIDGNTVMLELSLDF